ncbi:hypothetical protein VTJ04DRAFT_5194 [Mycothermus thermophilus]|uniref:uncharacterized protein n=1 Tax=Humicola insolens TaxID=85995 RepID=UPI003742964D
MAPSDEWWEVVKREVRDMLVPGLAKKGEGHVRRQDGPFPTAISKPEDLDDLEDEIPTSLVIAPTRATPTTTTISTLRTTSSLSATSTPTVPSKPDGNEGGGDNGVALKAGIVIGVLGGILVVFVIGWLIVSMRKKKLAQRRQQMEDDEKIHGPFSDSAAIDIRPTPSKAPRLSLRRVSGFLPGFGSPSGDNRTSRGMNMVLNPVSHSNSSATSPTPGADSRAATTSPAAGSTRTGGGGSAWERPALRLNMASPTGSNYNRPGTSASTHPSNPFHDKHHVQDEPVSPVSSIGSFDRRVGVATTSDSIPEPVSPILDNDSDDERYGNKNQHQHLNVSSVTRKTSIRKDLPKPLDLTKQQGPGYGGGGGFMNSPATPGGSSGMVPASPAGTEYSMHSIAPGQVPPPSATAAAIAAAGGPAHSTVHRVQLDFKPTLHDEMELKAGQLVRLLHEYDDGWALCIRLDRSEQGVVPRTCLSTRPVKPRNPQPQHQQQQQRNANPRGGPPISPSFHFGLDSPTTGSMSAAAGHHNRNGSAQSNRGGNNNGRSTPGGYGRPRSPGGWKRDDGPAPGQAY